MRTAALKRPQSQRCANLTPAGADQAVLGLWAGEVLKGTLYVSRAGSYTVTNSALVAALGAETDVTVRAYLARFLSPRRSRRESRRARNFHPPPFVDFVDFVVEGNV